MFGLDDNTVIVIGLVIVILFVYLLLPYLGGNRKIRVPNAGTKLVLFYRPDCPACVGFKPLWGTITSSVNCDTAEYNVNEPQAADVIKSNNLSVPTIPTIYKVTVNGWEKFNGDRSYNSIKNWAERG